ncbi:hypothetical protein KW792_01245 [Candidatus Saccharibacteria bacterium]|nr:hypothetical protein [Candidatus Saccharibacteria bacterium]
MDDMRERYRRPRQEYSPPVRRLTPTAPVRPHAPNPSPAPAAPTPKHRPAHTVQHAPAPAHHRDHTKPKRRWFLKTVIILIILGGLAGAAAYAYPKYHAKNPFPADVRSHAKFTLLYPTQLPAGYAVDKASVSTSNEILLFNAINSGQKMTFSEQKIPKGFDFSNFYKTGLANTQQFSTVYGQAAVGKAAGHYVGSLVAGDTWLLISTDSDTLNSDDFTNTLNHLKKY